MTDLWLEEVTGERALEWAAKRSEKTTSTLASARFDEFEAAALSILDSDDKIPYGVQRGEYIYNFWRDAQYPRGLWRRTTIDSYRTDQPSWDILLDVDALSRHEDENWVYKGVTLLQPSHDRALVSLSRGGADAAVVREFDMHTRQFIPPHHGGFELAEAKSSVSWIDHDHLYVGTHCEAGDLTDSGYPRTCRRWKRGTDLHTAPLVLEGNVADVAVSVSYDHTEGYERTFGEISTDFYHSRRVEIRGDELIDINIPSDSEGTVFRDWLFVATKSPWTVDEMVFPAGALLCFDYPTFHSDGPAAGYVTTLFTPTPSTALQGFSLTKTTLIVTISEDVSTKLMVLSQGDWQPIELSGLPNLADISVLSTDRDCSDDIFLVAQSFAMPPTLLYGDARSGVAPIKRGPSRFADSDIVVDQFFATSDDGTQIPYFVVRKPDVGPGPTLLYGYGGFEVSLTPSYLAVAGKLWLERGGTYVLANIRGGGEYGPTWHTGALKENRMRCYEDFSSIAKDVVARGITTRNQLAAEGGSNGGLLMGVMFTRFPELFKAIVCLVPLLDMERYHTLLAGASWMAEYGNPEVEEEWEYLSKYSPYHNIRADRDYPELLMYTSTRDDRVHPGHARRFVAKLEEAGYAPLYYENVEGGHGGAADNKQQAFRQALVYEFLWRHLTGG